METNKALTGNKIEISKMDKQVVQCICVVARELLCSGVEKGDVEFLRCAYDFLGLYDNKRIMEMSKRTCRTEFSLKQNILGDIIAVLLEEIRWNYNDGLLELLVGHYLQRYPSVESDLEKYDTVSDYLIAYKGREHGEHMFAVLCYLVLGRVAEEELKGLGFPPMNIYSRNNLPYVKSVYAKMLGVEDLDKSKLYQRFLLNKKEQVCGYLKTDMDKFEDRIMELLLNDGTVTGNVERISFMVKNIYAIIWNGSMNAEFYFSKNENNQKQAVRRAFETVCIELIADKISNEHRLEISQINRLVQIEDMNAFFCIFLSAVIFELCSEKVGAAVHECYKDFHFGNEDGKKVQELSAQIDRLKGQHKEKTDKMRAELDEKDSKIERLAEQSQEIRQKVCSAVEKQTGDYKKEIGRLKKQLENKEHDLKKMEAQLKSMEEFVKILSVSGNGSGDDNEAGTEIDIQKLQSKKYLFVGSVNEAMPGLKKDFPNSLFMNNESYSLKGIKVDKVVVFTGYVSHGMFYKIRNENRLKNVPVVWCNTKNKDIVYKRMQEAV